MSIEAIKKSSYALMDNKNIKLSNIIMKTSDVQFIILFS